MTDEVTKSTEDPRKKKINWKIIGVAMIIVGLGLILYLAFIGFGSNTRNDDVSLGTIESESQKNTVVLYVWGSGCVYCEQQKPIMKELEDDFENENVTFYWLDIAKHDDVADEYSIRGVPTTIVLNQNGVYKKLVGFSDYDEIERAIKNSISTYSK
jgi:thioredoxin 1